MIATAFDPSDFVAVGPNLPPGIKLGLHLTPSWLEPLDSLTGASRRYCRLLTWNLAHLRFLILKQIFVQGGNRPKIAVLGNLSLANVQAEKGHISGNGGEGNQN